MVDLIGWKAELLALFELTWDEVRDKGMRILVVCFILLMAQVVMEVVKRTSRFMVYAQWGPFKYVFRNRLRAITLHGVLINLAKYVVYVISLGYILTELGVNYTTYIASLSLIGIAIGFGSQGLVQDVVTGFFILFENQFAVGNMVEVAGQVGVVEDIGLRTTRIRTYLGGQAVLQNRNIPSAVRYDTGGLEVGVDVAVGDDVAGAVQILELVGREVAKQFKGIILEAPRSIDLVTLETGEVFVRLRTKIWPAQQWVIDAQLIPRIREAFKQREMSIPGDRVVAFYHFPKISF